MDDETPWYTAVVLPVLLGAARRTYGRAIATALGEAGFTDMPRSGSRVVGGIARSGEPMRDVVKALGVSKQAAGQLIDTLVLRGYVERLPDPEDRRRRIVGLTPRGADAAAVVRAAVEGVDAALEARVGAQAVVEMRATVAALVEMADPHFGTRF